MTIPPGWSILFFMAAKKKNKRYSCGHCGTEFPSPHKKKFCSVRCRRDSAKNKPRSLGQFIIDKFLGEEIWKNKNFVFREMKFSNKLIEKYPLQAFWKSLPPKFDMNSLSWFLGEQGKTYLRVEYAKFSLDLKAPPKYDLKDVKQGKDKKVPRKLKSLIDFIKYGGKKENS